MDSLTAESLAYRSAVARFKPNTLVRRADRHTMHMVEDVKATEDGAILVLFSDGTRCPVDLCVKVA